MSIFHRDFDRSPVAMLNRFLPSLGKFWGLIFRFFNAMGLFTTPSNLWIIENAKTLIKDRFETEEENIHQDYKDILQLLSDATHSDKVNNEFEIFIIDGISFFFFISETYRYPRIIEPCFRRNGLWL